MPVQAPAKPGSNQGQAAPVAPWPFPVGVYESTTQDYDESVTQTTSPVQFPIYNFTPTGWLRGAWFQFDMTVTGQSTNSVSYHNDNPWSVINKMTFYDLGQQPVIGPIGGYDWYTINVYGAYQFQGDPKGDITYSASTGTGSTAGSFTFVLYLPLEIVGRDALGTVQNESKPGWKVELWMDSQANTYNQVPSVEGSLRVRVFPDSYTEPAEAAPGGRPYSQTPPKPGTKQYWRSENETQPSGSSEYDLVNGIGFPIRNILWKVIDTSAGTRSDSDFPDPVTVTYGNVQLLQMTQTQWKTRAGRDFNLTSTTADNAFAWKTGVFPEYFTKDFGLHPGAELRYKYLQTKINTVLRLSGSFGAACTLYALTNWVVPPTGDYFSLLSSR